jgi:cysteine-rich repeat protein
MLNLDSLSKKSTGYASKALKSARSAQILVTTLLLLMIVSLTVVGITFTTLSTTRQVQTTVEYQKSYNYAESRILQEIDLLSNLDFNLQDLETQGLSGAGCGNCTQKGMDEYVCTCDEDEPDRKTAVVVKEVNYLENYDLANGEYFDVILSEDTGPSFKGTINLSWVGSTAFELSLFYEGGGDVDTQQQIIDPTGDVYENTGSGFFSTNPVINGNSVDINLSHVNPSKVPGTSKYKYLRVRVVNKQAGTSISIRPSTSSISLPNQVRRIEALSYLTTNQENSAPAVIAQLPLKPPVADPLSYSLNLFTIVGKLCGNNVIETHETCDDGNVLSNDDCLSNCSLNECGDGIWNENGPVNTEQCDDGNALANDDCITFLGANPTCQLNVCGDGFRNTLGPNNMEECDRGAANTTTCTPPYNGSCTFCQQGSCDWVSIGGSYCGDGVRNIPQEQCDRGSNNTTTCTPPYGGSCSFCRVGTCRWITRTGPYCGDGNRNWGHERCDRNGDAGCPSTHYCSNNCQRCIVKQVCGDGKITGNEVCDTDKWGNHIYKSGYASGGCSSDCMRSKGCLLVGIRKCPPGTCSPGDYAGCSGCDYPGGTHWGEEICCDGSNCGKCESCACCRDCWEDINNDRSKYSDGTGVCGF